jgi:hypothetical protein
MASESVTELPTKFRLPVRMNVWPEVLLAVLAVGQKRNIFLNSGGKKKSMFFSNPKITA